MSADAARTSSGAPRCSRLAACCARRIWACSVRSGVGEVRVFSRPRVRLVVTGNELLPSGSRPHGYRIADANGPMLAALVERDGGVVDFPGLVPDEPRGDPRRAPGRGRRDHRLRRLERRHRGSRADAFSRDTASWPFTASPCGPAVRPASDGSGTRLVFLLPGNPVSCSVRLRFLRRPRDSRARRTHQGVAVPPDARQAGAQDQLADRPARLRPRASWSTARSSRSPSAARPCSRRPRGPTASSSSPTTAKGFAPGAEVEVWLYA